MMKPVLIVVFFLVFLANGSPNAAELNENQYFPVSTSGEPLKIEAYSVEERNHPDEFIKSERKRWFWQSVEG